MSNDSCSNDVVSPTSQCKHWCFTSWEGGVVNAEGVPIINSDIGFVFDEQFMSYICYQPEKCPDSGRFHIQGVVSFKNKLRLAQVRSYFPKAPEKKNTRLAPKSKYSSFLQWSDYCKKNDRGGVGAFVECGILPVIGHQAGAFARSEQFDEALVVVKTGKFEQLSSEFQFKYLNAAKGIFHLHASVNVPLLVNTVHTGVWVWGTPGSGKSLWARSHLPHFVKDVTKWFDDYQYQPFVIVEDVDPQSASFCVRHFKIWLDRYQFRGQTKGGHVMLRPLLTFFTSNYSIEECFPNAVDVAAIRRRCMVHHFTDPFSVGISVLPPILNPIVLPMVPDVALAVDVVNV